MADPLCSPRLSSSAPMTRTLGEADEIEEFLRPSLPGRAVFGSEAIGSSMFSSAVSVGTRLKNWKTKPRLSQSNTGRASLAQIDRLEPFT